MSDNLLNLSERITPEIESYLELLDFPEFKKDHFLKDFKVMKSGNEVSEKYCREAIVDLQHETEEFKNNKNYNFCVNLNEIKTPLLNVFADDNHTALITYDNLNILFDKIVINVECSFNLCMSAFKIVLEESVNKLYEYLKNDKTIVLNFYFTQNGMRKLFYTDVLLNLLTFHMRNKKFKNVILDLKTHYENTFKLRILTALHLPLTFKDNYLTTKFGSHLSDNLIINLIGNENIPTIRLFNEEDVNSNILYLNSDKKIKIIGNSNYFEKLKDELEPEITSLFHLDITYDVI